MAVTMPGKPFNESDIQPMRLHLMDHPHMPSVGPAAKPSHHTPSRLPALRQEGYNGGGGMASPIMKGRVLEGPIHDVRALPNLGDGSFSHLNERGRDSVDSDRKRRTFARMRTMPVVPFTRSAMSVPEDDKPRLFNPDPMPYQASNFNPPLAKVRVEGTGVLSLPKLASPYPRGPSTMSHDRSSTVIKKVPTIPRHQDMWGAPSPMDMSGAKHKGFVMHAERYQLQVNAEAYPRPPGWNQPPTGPIGLDLPTGRHVPGLEPLPRPLTEFGRPRPNSSGTRASFPLDHYHAYYNALMQQTPAPELPNPIVAKGLHSSSLNNYPKSPQTPFRFGKWNDFSRGGGSEGIAISQRDRMALEHEYMERMKVYKRRREIIQHREPIDLLLGGEKVAYTERLDITGELSRLKQIVLPKKAKDLYVGRGFVLPQSHTLNKPRKKGLGQKNKNDKPPNTPAVDTSGNGVKWQNPEGDEKSRDTGLNDPHNQTTIRPESEMEIKLATNQPAKVEQDITLQNISSPTKSASPSKGLRNNPLKGFITPRDDRTVQNLRDIYKRIDADSDGHIKFASLKSELPESFKETHAVFIKVIYDTCCTSSVFGEDEFISAIQLSQKISSLRGKASDAFDEMKKPMLRESFSQYAELFESVDRQDTGRISLDALREVLATAQGTPPDESFTNVKVTLKENIPTLNDSIEKHDYLVHIPYFMTLETNT